jgi:hypothetical protein
VAEFRKADKDKTQEPEAEEAADVLEETNKATLDSSEDEVDYTSPERAKALCYATKELYTTDEKAEALC